MKLPEDLRVALEQWRLMDERLAGFRRLGDVLRLCAEAYDRITEAERQSAGIHQQLAVATERLRGVEEAEQRQRDTLADQRAEARRAWQREMDEERAALATQRQDLEATTAEMMARRGDLARLRAEIEQEEARLETIRRQIRALVAPAMTDG